MTGPSTDRADTPGGPAFGGFAAKDFEAYLPKKWSSNAFTRERRMVKDKLVALAKRIKERTAGLGPLDLHATDEAPTIANGKKVDRQLVVFLRDADSRRALRPLTGTTDLASPQLFDIAIEHQHACLTLAVDQDGLAVSVELAAKAVVDRDNAAEKLRQPWARERFAELVRALPEGARVGFGEALAPATEPPATEALVSAFADGDQPFRVRAALAKSDPALAGAGCIDAVAGLVATLAPVYEFLAWTRENDHTKLKETIKKTVEKREQKKQKEQEKQGIGAGDRVTILSGLFSGRSGTLAEVDAKGRAKVMVGPVSVSVELKDLKAL